MAIASLRYTPPVRKDPVTRSLDYDLIETAEAEFGNGDARASTQTVFKHLFPNDTPDIGKPFAFTQGSSRVSFAIDGETVKIAVPLVRVPAGGGGIAALRYVLQRCNGSGQLFQGRLHGDDVIFEFSEKLPALHPAKLLEVLRRMPGAADAHDDWMVAQFGVQPLERGNVVALSDDEAATAEQVWRQHWTDVEELHKEAQKKRSVWFLNEVTAFAINRIRFSVPMGGSLLPRLNENAHVFNDAHVDPMKRETVLGKFAKEMKALPADEVRKSLGHVEFAINPFSEGTPEKLVEYFGPNNYMETIENYRTSGHPMDAGLALIGTYYYLMATCSWPEEVLVEMKGALAESSDKPWREAAALMMEHAQKLVSEFGEDTESDEDEDEDEEDEEEAS